MVATTLVSPSVAAAGPTAAAAGPTADAAGPTVERIAGSDRYATAAAVARDFPVGVGRVFLATGRDFPDALAASAVAGRLHAAVLLVERTTIPEPTRATLRRLQPGAITVLGGTAAVSEAVQDAAADLTDGPVDRVSGRDRYATAAALVDRHVPWTVPVVMVATGEGFADALSGGPAAVARGGPLLLVRPTEVPDATAASLARLDPDQVVVLGGRGAIADSVVADLEQLGATVSRVAGPDRYATSARTVGVGFPAPPDTVLLTTGEDFPDALSAGALAGTRSWALLTARRDCVPRPVLDQLDRIAPSRVLVVGGTAALGDGAAELTPCDDGPDVRATTVHSGLDVPWDLVVTPDERVFLTERDRGRILERHGDGSLTLVASFDVDNDHEGGLTGLAVAPGWRDDPWLYAMYVGGDHRGDPVGDDAPTFDQRVVRLRPDGTDVQVVVDDLPSGTADNQSHFSGRVDFGPDGRLYVAVGDVRIEGTVQDPTALNGKILRYEPDGSVPADNPFVARTPDEPRDDPVWALGFRDPQGMAWDAQGRMFGSEFGPNANDEINRILPGANYGWPRATGTSGSSQGWIGAIVVRQPPQASWSGISVLTDGAIPEWEGDLFVAALRGQRLYRIDLEDGEVVDVEERLVGTWGRLRHVVGVPDGSLWLLTSNQDDNGDPVPGDDRIVRLGPPEAGA